MSSQKEVVSAVFRTERPEADCVNPTDIPLAEVASLGRNCKWNRPSCSCGSEKVWGHGYVTRYFVGLASALLLKRYRCPLCGRVFTMIPADSGRRIQSPVSAVLGAIRSRLSHQGWPHAVPRQRATHWLRKFLQMCRLHFPEDDPLTVLTFHHHSAAACFS